MACIDNKSKFDRQLDALPDHAKFGQRRITVEIGEMTGVDFDDRSTYRPRGFDLLAITADEQRDPDAGFAEQSYRIANPIELTDHVEPTFGGELHTPFGHQANIVRPDLHGDLQHVPRDRSFEVHPRLQQAA